MPKTSAPGPKSTSAPLSTRDSTCPAVTTGAIAGMYAMVPKCGTEDFVEKRSANQAVRYAIFRNPSSQVCFQTARLTQNPRKPIRRDQEMLAPKNGKNKCGYIYIFISEIIVQPFIHKRVVAGC